MALFEADRAQKTADWLSGNDVDKSVLRNCAAQNEEFENRIK